MPIRKDKERKYITLDRRSLDQLHHLKKIYKLQPSKLIELALDDFYAAVLFNKIPEGNPPPLTPKEEKEMIKKYGENWEEKRYARKIEEDKKRFKERFGFEPVEGSTFWRY